MNRAAAEAAFNEALAPIFRVWRHGNLPGQSLMERYLVSNARRVRCSRSRRVLISVEK